MAMSSKSINGTCQSEYTTMVAFALTTVALADEKDHERARRGHAAKWRRRPRRRTLYSIVTSFPRRRGRRRHSRFAQNRKSQIDQSQIKPSVYSVVESQRSTHNSRNRKSTNRSSVNSANYAMWRECLQRLLDLSIIRGVYFERKTEGCRFSLDFSMWLKFACACFWLGL